MKMYRGENAKINVFLTLALVAGEWPASHTWPITPVPTRLEAQWASEQVWMTWRGEKYCLYQDSNSDPSVDQPIASHYIDYVIAARNKCYEMYKLNKLSEASASLHKTFKFMRIYENQ
jgi:hypothetical protein